MLGVEKVFSGPSIGKSSCPTSVVIADKDNSAIQSWNRQPRGASVVIRMTFLMLLLISSGCFRDQPYLSGLL